MLQLLQFEVGVHRDDPSTRVWLQRAAETEGITAKHVDWMGVICLEQRTRGLHRRPGHLCDTASHVLPWGFVQVSESGLWAASVQASCGLSGSHSLIYAARWTSPCVQATRHKLELGRLAFDLALKRRQAEVPKDYDQIAWLLRQLISTCTHHTRHDAKRYFEAARDELERFSPANCPMGEDELHWSATHASSRP